MLANLKGNHSVAVKLGTVTLQISANPVFDAGGTRVGTVVQWADRTQELLTENEVKATVELAIAGDLTVRIDATGKEGFFKTLADGMNRLIGNMADVVRAMALMEQARNLSTLISLYQVGGAAPPSGAIQRDSERAVGLRKEVRTHAIL